MKFAHVLSRLTGAPWFITEDALLRITDLLEMRLATGAVSGPLPLPAEDTDPDGDDLPAQVPGIGIVEINGVLGQHLSLMERLCGGCDYGDIVSQIRSFAYDPTVAKIVMHFMVSPGGTASGCAETFAALRQIKMETGKPIVSVITGMACSAAYYLAAAGDTILATETSMVGSIGSMRMVEDRSARNEAKGVKRFAITSGTMKDIGNPDRPMTDEEKNILQSMIGYLGGVFKRDMLSMRPGIADEVFATALPYIAGKDGQRLGLVDAIVPNLEILLGSLAQPIA